MLRMHHTDHLFPADSESGTSRDGSGRCQTQLGDCRERLFAHKVSCGKERDRSFFPGWGNHRDLCSALLKIEYGVRGISLRIEGFLWRQLDDSSPQACARKESGYIETDLFKFNRRGAYLQLRPLQVIAGGVRGSIASSLTKLLR